MAVAGQDRGIARPVGADPADVPRRVSRTHVRLRDRRGDGVSTEVGLLAGRHRRPPLPPSRAIGFMRDRADSCVVGEPGHPASEARAGCLVPRWQLR
jgi:hypothetical protein